MKPQRAYTFLNHTLGMLACAGILVLTPLSSFAVTLQILHTNDLHAALETAGAPEGNEPELGGWAQVKSVMDELTGAAAKENIETIRLDAGDFTEGTSFYFPDSGRNVLRAFQNMGYDAAALGNHDWLMGAETMDKTFGAVPFPFPVLSANARISSRMKNLSEQILPTTEITRAGIHIGIFGLSTDEVMYRWITQVDSRKHDLDLVDYEDNNSDDVYGNQPGIASHVVSLLRANNDVVIGLTHIGLPQDIRLAQRSKGIDLIVGGHSHSQLDTARTITDLEGHKVPIVQTGFNGRYVGEVRLDVEPGKRPTLKSYRLVAVPHSTVQDTTVKEYVDAARERSKEAFPHPLDEVFGTSDVVLKSASDGPTAYGKFVVDAMKDASGSEIAVDVGAFHGNTPQEAGPVTFKKIVELYPRKFEVSRNQGLYIYKATIPGWVLKLGIHFAVKYNFNLSLAGITYDLERISDREFNQLQKKDKSMAKFMSHYRATNIRVNGSPLRSLVGYEIAAPESLVRGAYGVSPLLKLILKHGHSTGITIWDAEVQYLTKIHTIHDLP